jgi:hypothetical protein
VSWLPGAPFAGSASSWQPSNIFFGRQLFGERPLCAEAAAQKSAAYSSPPQVGIRRHVEIGADEVCASVDATRRGYVGRRNGDDLVYAGKVDHDFDKVSAADLQKRLKPLIRQTQPYAKRIAHKGIWVEPKLLAEIEYRAKSAEGKVRHPFFRGLREDL